MRFYHLFNGCFSGYVLTIICKNDHQVLREIVKLTNMCYNIGELHGRKRPKILRMCLKAIRNFSWGT